MNVTCHLSRSSSLQLDRVSRLQPGITMQQLAQKWLVAKNKQLLCSTQEDLAWNRPRYVLSTSTEYLFSVQL